VRAGGKGYSIHFLWRQILRIKILTLRYSQQLFEFDDHLLEQFQDRYQLTSFEPKYFEVHGIPHLSFVMGYEQSSIIGEATSPPSTDQIRPAKKTPPDQGLSEPDQRLFESLRQWRTEKSRSEGVPPYVILTNKQLREIVERKPKTKTALAKIESLGTARIKRHGEELLLKLHSKSQADISAPESDIEIEEAG
jgi:superfamily II DNA helicase RecQ